MKPRNFIAKNLGVNRSQVFVDRKKEAKAGVYKHQAYLEHEYMEELYSFDKYRGYCIGITLNDGVFNAEAYQQSNVDNCFFLDGRDVDKLLADCKNAIDEVLDDD